MTTLAGTESHPNARVALAAALAGTPSHAFLFHGPPGVGKRRAARSFAAELLAEGAADPDGVRARVENGSHPDLTWVRPTGAHVMRTEDVDQPVIAAATRTPFEASRRVFVLERVDTMNDEVANRLLKTLEEPARFVHLILVTDALAQVIPTVLSRCQLVRFDPLPAERIADHLEQEGIPHDRARACARLALGNDERARWLASEEGAALIADVDRILACALGGAREPQPWLGLLERSKARSGDAEARVTEECGRRLESEPKGRDRNAIEKRFEEAARREGRRAKTEVLSTGLTLAALAFRDLICLAEGAPGAALDPDRVEARAPGARSRDPRRLRQAVERCEETRMSLQVNVSEDLALEALGYRLTALVGSA